MPARPASALALVVVLGASIADASAYRGLYVTLHNTLGLWTWLLCAAALAPFVRARRVPALLCAVALSSQLALAAPGQSHVLGTLHGAFEPRLLSALRKVLDRDADGASALLGGGDCDDADRARHPGACELAQTVADDNCNGSARVPAEPGTAVARAPRSPLPDVYLVVVDALRADVAADARAMPSLNALAARSLRFGRAYAAYPSTSHSLRTLAQSRSARRLRSSVPDLFGLALAAGYDVRVRVQQKELSVARTSALTSKLPAISMPALAGKSQWTGQIIDATIAELQQPQQRGPRLRWLHLFDVHAPWPQADAALPLRERYVRAAHRLDAQLGRLFDALERSERGRAAAVIVLGDHGEQLGEHGVYFHGSGLWEQQLHVPLVMHLPGVPAGMVHAPASLIDVAPTLAAYFGWDTPASFEGHDWLSHPEAREAPPAAELSSTRELLGGLGRPTLHAVIGERYKLMLNVSDNLLEIYDLERDPGERSPLQSSADPEVAALRRALVRFQDLPGCSAD
jgi:hypothetical protein